MQQSILDQRSITQVGFDDILNEHFSSCFPGRFPPAIVRSVSVIPVKCTSIVFYRVYSVLKKYGDLSSTLLSGTLDEVF